jgi:hypothetical protein
MDKKLLITRDRKDIEQYCKDKCKELKEGNCVGCPLSEKKYCVFEHMTDRSLTVAYDKMYQLNGSD